MKKRYSRIIVIASVFVLMFFSFIVISLLFMISCSSSDPLLDERFHTEEHLPEYDMQNQFGMLSAICETEEAYYFSATFGKYLWYVNKETGECGKLCGNPQCRHNHSACNAYVYSTLRSGISLYDGRLYWIGEPDYTSSEYFIWSMKTDGTDRRKEQRIQEFVSDYNPMVRLHRGYIYTASVIFDVEGASPTTTLHLTQSILGKEDSTKTIFEVTREGEQIGYQYQIYRNDLYLMYYYSGELYIYKYDIEEEKTSCIYEAKDTSLKSYNLWVDETGLYWAEKDDTLTGYAIMKYDHQSQRTEVLIQGKDESQINMDIGYQKLIQIYIEDDLKCFIKNNQGEVLREERVRIGDEETDLSIDGGWPLEDCVLVSLTWQRLEGMKCALVRIPYDKNQEAGVLCQIDVL